MYVVRPQHLSHASGCGSAGGRGPHHNGGRQAAKNQRRTQPKQRRPQGSQRRRFLLKDIVRAGHVGHRLRLTAEPTGDADDREALHPVDGFEDSEDAANGEVRRGRGCVRARLRARLVQRSTAELIATLERRRGDQWAEHVLRGDFHAFEGMRRICEAFSLRPDLERQVLKAAADRAHAHQNNKAALAEEAKHFDARLFRRPSTDAPQLMLGKRDLAEENADVASTSDGGSATGTLDGASSEAASVDGLDEASEDEMDCGQRVEMAVLAPAAEATSSATVGPWRTTWKMRVLRVLGLQRFCSSSREVSDAESEHHQAASSRPNSIAKTDVSCAAEASDLGRKQEAEGVVDEDTEEEEEHALSSKLVAAVRNAELHAAAARASQGKHQHHNAQCSCIARSSSSVRYASKSEVSFFHYTDAPLEDPSQYRRALDTKVFDGPSGHKAKRICASRCPSDEEDDDCGPEGDEEWEDRCDDIAELMGQPRSCLLWSQSW